MEKTPPSAKRKTLKPRRGCQIFPEAPASLRIDPSFGGLWRGELPIPEAQTGSDCCMWAEALGWMRSPPLLIPGPLSPSPGAWVGGASPAYLLPLHPLPKQGPGSFVGGGVPTWEATLWDPSGLGGAGVPKASQSAVRELDGQGSGQGSGLPSPPSRRCAWGPSKSAPLLPR